MLRATDCPVFEVKAKINVSVPSDGINRSIIAQADSDLWSIQKLEQDLMMLPKKMQYPAQPSPFLGSTENTTLLYLPKKSKYLKANFL